VVVNPLLTVSVSGASPICSGDNAVFSFSGGPANGTVDITVNGTPQTVTLDGSGNGTYTVTGATVDQTLALVTVSDGTCSNTVSGTATITISPLLTVNMTAVSPICNGADAIFTFTGGPANGTVDITVNGTPQTITLDASGNGSFTVTGATTNQTVNLVSVASGSCSNTVTGTSTVVVNPLLSVSMSASSPVCNGADAIFNFTSGPLNGTVNITVNGSPQTVTLDASGNGTFTVTGATADQTAVLVDVSDGTCSNTVTGTVTVVVNPLLSVSVAAPSPICSGDDAIFNFSGGPANGTVNITVNGTPQTVTLDGLGNGTYTVTGATSDQTVNLVTVSDGTCSNTVTGTATVVVNTLLSATVTPVTPVCAGSDAVFNFTGPANGTIDITVNGTPQTVTLDASGNGTYTVTGANADQTVNLVAVGNGSCSNPAAGTVTVVVNPIPTTSPIFHD
jgi:allophanate hydrolase subunit 2